MYGELSELHGVARGAWRERAARAVALRRVRPCARRAGPRSDRELSRLRREVPLLRREALEPPCVGRGDGRGGVRVAPAAL